MVFFYIVRRPGHLPAFPIHDELPHGTRQQQTLGGRLGGLGGLARWHLDELPQRHQDSEVASGNGAKRFGRATGDQGVIFI